MVVRVEVALDIRADAGTHRLRDGRVFEQRQQTKREWTPIALSHSVRTARVCAMRSSSADRSIWSGTSGHVACSDWLPMMMNSRSPVMRPAARRT